MTIVHTILPETGESLVYDLERACVVREITDYSIFLLHDRNLKPTTVAQTITHLVRLWAYLLRSGRTLNDVSDAALKAFFLAELETVKANKISRGSERAAKNTVNQKVGAVLNWLFWLQEQGVCPEDTIGPIDHRVTAQPYRSSQPGWTYRRGVSSRLFLSNAGAADGACSVEKETYDSLVKEIMENSRSSYLAHRNVLFVDIAKNAGFRRGSICSLRKEQFERKTLETTRNSTVPLKPIEQKLSYEHTFEVDLTLALRVCDFVDGPRAELLKDLGISDRQDDGHIFLSEKTGKRITARAMTKAISGQMRAIGAAKGQAIHVFRGLFANDLIKDEHEERVAEGRDTSTSSVSAAVSTALGHKNPDSMFTYISNQQSRIARRRRSEIGKKRDQD